MLKEAIMLKLSINKTEFREVVIDPRFEIGTLQQQAGLGFTVSLVFNLKK
jgi:hypothetical protein